MKLREISFDLISILEGISAAQDHVRISTTAWKETSTPDTISTSFKRIPYKSSIKGSEPIYSILNYVSSPESTKLLTSLKGKGPYIVNEKQIDQLLTGVVGACKQIMVTLDPDVILYPKSSSPLVKQFVDKLHRAYPKVKIADEAFVKKVLQAGDEDALLNTQHPDWKKFADENPESVEDLKKNLKRHIKDGNLELKKLYKPYVKFIKNFVEMKDASNTLDQVIEKRILVVDDVFSTGSTILEMFRQLREFEPEAISGLTIFKRTSETRQ
jgi:hypothetical protein